MCYTCMSGGKGSFSILKPYQVHDKLFNSWAGKLFCLAFSQLTIIFKNSRLKICFACIGMNIFAVNKQTNQKTHKTMETQIFLTDYASYNEGSQFKFGHWVDLSQFNDASELMEYIRNHFEECDRESPLSCGSTREEIMVTDYEGFPEALYSEAMSEKEFEKVFKFIEISSEIEDNLIGLWNEYQAEISANGEIFENDEEFFELFYANKPLDAVRAAFYGDWRYSDDYVRFNGYENLESFNEPEESIDKDELIEWLIENR